MTDYLFARPSFLSGVARSVDLFGTFTGYNISPTPTLADAIALANDWRAVSVDLSAGMGRFAEEAAAEIAAAKRALDEAPTKEPRP